MRPELVQDGVVRQALMAISFAPGAAPAILPSNILCAAVMPATCVPCAAEMPRLTYGVPALS
jgi:hypothetical protein